MSYVASTLSDRVLFFFVNKSTEKKNARKMPMMKMGSIDF